MSPKNTGNNIPYNLARQLKTIVSNSEILEQMIEEVKSATSKRMWHSGSEGTEERRPTFNEEQAKRTT